MKTFIITSAIFIQSLSFSAFAFDASLIGARTLIIKGIDSQNELFTVTDNVGTFRDSQEAIKAVAVFHLPMSLTGEVDVCSRQTCKKIALPFQFGGGVTTRNSLQNLH
ncbi:hypothetical protein BC355_18980 [Vibrio cholerae]|uniref:Uncharacterized protein n=1 Tax=Vibrio cholerae TaxID=666 RepID=A0A395U0U8_VIBCL|nr:hypothetical protein [Vibrio cholerae]RGP90655.1 hypothetical protein BC354_19450 [Vibrio cholerae]RGP90691.1 hypothetical protein BC355_18980 [Vibrio cholerae]RGP90978.1 hypothetical protein BC353_18915 [Vibrio cholerae]RGP95572.1 hypothetical protein BC352_18955 [Vibrio cholerae]